jgi:hypothetical protein
MTKDESDNWYSHDNIRRLEALANSETVPNSCPYYKNGTTCNGDVVFKAGSSFGTCKKCGRDIPLIVEM